LGEYEDPEFWKEFEDQGDSIEIEESGKATLQLKLIPAPAER
jgi:hypothetical protein